MNHIHASLQQKILLKFQKNETMCIKGLTAEAFLLNMVRNDLYPFKAIFSWLSTLVWNSQEMTHRKLQNPKTRHLDIWKTWQVQYTQTFKEPKSRHLKTSKPGNVKTATSKHLNSANSRQLKTSKPWTRWIYTNKRRNNTNGATVWNYKTSTSTNKKHTQFQHIST